MSVDIVIGQDHAQHATYLHYPRQPASYLKEDHPMSAQLEEHNYGGYRPKTFYIVVCRECLVALNSGHHYTEDVKHFAQELADEHNRLNHEGEGDLVTDPAEIEQIKARLQYTAGEFEDYSDEFEASR